MQIWYRPDPAPAALPSGPSSALNDTLIYEYATRTDNNPFQEPDDNATPRQFKDPIVLGNRSGPETGGAGMLQFVIANSTTIVNVTIQWDLVFGAS